MIYIWVYLKMLCTPFYPMVNDHYPYENWLFHWEYTQHFQTNPYVYSIHKRYVMDILGKLA